MPNAKKSATLLASVIDALDGESINQLLHDAMGIYGGAPPWTNLYCPDDQIAAFRQAMRECLIPPHLLPPPKT